MTERRFYVGTDIGGTFTDMVVIDQAGDVRLFKSPTTPADRSEGVVQAFGIAAEHFGLDTETFIRSVDYFAHATTAATNALIEHTGARTMLLTTRGFRDALLIQRATASWAAMGDRSGHYSARRPQSPIVPREWIVEIDERVDSTGAEVVPLAREQVKEAVVRAQSAGIEAVAICYLWSFLRTDHEQETAAIVREMWPEACVSLSSDIAPVLGEYERAATTTINAYLSPVIKDYVNRLEGRLRGHGFRGQFAVMDSIGGVMAAEAAAERAVELLMSGPAGGVLSSAALGRSIGAGNIITADMGGTSFDVGLVVDGQPLVSAASFDAGYHLVAPRVSVTARGAGGGSIASIVDGILLVGPESAGSTPGPACYGKGGDRPTVTDADVVLGILDPDSFLDGKVPLRRDLAEEAIRRHVAEPLGMSVREAAQGIRRVVDAQMADQLRAASIQQGYDPRDFTLFAYGGAGATHAYSFAPDAGIHRVVVPYTATVHSAFGAVSSDQFRLLQGTDRQRTPAWAADPVDHLDLNRIVSKFHDLEQRCRAAFGDDPRVRVQRHLYFRYRGQAKELAVPVESLENTEDLRAVVAEFHSRYERLYGPGTSLVEAGIEIGTFRVEGRLPSPAPRAVHRVATEAAGDALAGRREVVLDGVATLVDVYRAPTLAAGSHIAGPAIIDSPGTTIVVGVGQGADVDEDGNVVLDVRSAPVAAGDLMTEVTPS